MNSLPTEINQSIRRYGYTPFVSDSALYEMIQDINPTYSLSSLLDRLIVWKAMDNLYQRNRDVVSFYKEYIEDNDTVVSLSYEGIYKTYGPSDISLDSLIGQKNNLIDYINHIGENPISPAVVTLYGGAYGYAHIPTVGREILYEPYNADTVRQIVSLYPSFSLNKEYEKVKVRQRYVESLPDEMITFLTQLYPYIRQVYSYTDQDNIYIELYQGDNPTVFIPSGWRKRTDNYDGLEISYTTNSSTELFFSVIAYLWRGYPIRMKGTESREPTYRVPFAN